MDPNRWPVAYVLRRFAVPRWGRLAGGLLLVLASFVPQRVPALIVGVSLDALLLDDRPFSLPLVPDAWLPADASGQFALVIGAVAVAVAAETLLYWYGQLSYEAAVLELLHEVRYTTYQAVTELELSVHGARSGGDLVSVLHNDVDNLENLFEGGREGVQHAGLIASAFGFMLVVNWQLALVLATVPLLVAASARLYARLLEPCHDDVRQSVGAVNTRLHDALQGIATVKAATREPDESDRLAAASAAYRTANWSTVRLRLGYNAASYLVASTGSWGLLLLGGYWVLAGPPLWFSVGLTAGGLLTFLIYAQTLLEPTRQFAVEVVDKYESGRASSKRVVELLEHDAREREADSRDVPSLDGSVTYRDVTFSYPGADEPTLSDVSVAVQPREFVGVVGPTGSGKSTLLKLLLRFYDPDEGQVLLDGEDVASLSPGQFRANVGYVSQEPFLFEGTVEENVAYAVPDPDRDAVVAAAERAGADEFVRELPSGYDTEVGDGGSGLSGGQRQRIAIARALYHDPDVLLLDEATSHVDNETEAEIQRQLADVRGSRTVFAVAHRLSTVRDADRILVVDDGRIVEEGTHEELLRRGGRYADLWRVQVGETVGDAPPGHARSRP